MRAAFCLALFPLLLTPPASPQESSALDRDPSGWINLLSDASLKGWTRLPVPATAQMSEVSPWVYDAGSGILLCNGDKSGHEWFRFDREFGNCILHAEWRFTKAEGDAKYNSGVYTRNNANAGIWHQAQIGGGTGGFLFGSTPANGAPQRFNLREQLTDQRVRPAGEWNALELRAENSKLTLWVNGAVTSEYGACGAPRGFVGLEAEGYRIEFRRVMLKELP